MSFSLWNTNLCSPKKDLPVAKFNPNLVYWSDCRITLSNKALSRKIAFEFENYDSSSEEETKDKPSKPKEIIYE